MASSTGRFQMYFFVPCLLRDGENEEFAILLDFFILLYFITVQENRTKKAKKSSKGLLQAMERKTVYNQNTALSQLLTTT